MPFITDHPFDAANVASKLPSALQKPAGMALEGLKQAFGGGDPRQIVGAGVSIGPNAIPLADEEGYLRSAVGSSLDDLGHHLAQSENDDLVPYTLWNAMGDPSLIHKIMGTAESLPGMATRMMKDWGGPNAMPNLQKITQSLADVYHKGRAGL